MSRAALMIERLTVSTTKGDLRRYLLNALAEAFVAAGGDYALSLQLVDEHLGQGFVRLAAFLAEGYFPGLLEAEVDRFVADAWRDDDSILHAVLREGGGEAVRAAAKRQLAADARVELTRIAAAWPPAAGVPDKSQQRA